MWTANYLSVYTHMGRTVREMEEGAQRRLQLQAACRPVPTARASKERGEIACLEERDDGDERISIALNNCNVLSEIYSTCIRDYIMAFGDID